MSSAGRRPPFYLGIDLGGTNIKSGVVDDLGQSLSSVSLETEADRGPEVGINNLAEAGRQAVAASGLTWDQIVGVGLGGTSDLCVALAKRAATRPLGSSCNEPQEDPCGCRTCRQTRGSNNLHPGIVPFAIFLPV